MKPIFEWELPKDHPNFTGHDDLPEAYRVFKDEKGCVGGIMIEARWNGKWEANPWNTRTLVRHLLEKLDKKNKSRPDIILREEDYRTFYKAYPKKKAPGQAEKTWNALERKKKLPSLEVLLDALEKQKKSFEWIKQKGKFIPHPSTWLNARCWEDELGVDIEDPIEDRWEGFEDNQQL